MISNWGLLYDVCVIMDTLVYADVHKGPSKTEFHYHNPGNDDSLLIGRSASL